MSTRDQTVAICEPLAIEDYVVQPVAEVSPPKWHLGHTTWFFEELLLVAFIPDYSRYDERYRELFNSYYKSAGRHWIQGERGNLSRPTVDEVLAYRRHVDDGILALLQSQGDNPEIRSLLEIGLNHEQQHQELLYMDIKTILGANPLVPVYSNVPLPRAPAVSETWKTFNEGVYEIGHDGSGFAYDNEQPRHKSYLHAFAIANSLVTNRDYLEFIGQGGYEHHSHWLSLGWDWVTEHGIGCPLYWQKEGDNWHEFTLHGQVRLDPEAPVSHISYFEADAYARWKGYRLPTEQELEIFLGSGTPAAISRTEYFHPVRADSITGQLWQWSSSHYSPYPGYRPFDGLLEEYNGKFMCSQFVLRGGCIATPPGHFRNSYRNFFLPHQRWMYSGIRLARDTI